MNLYCETRDIEPVEMVCHEQGMIKAIANVDAIVVSDIASQRIEELIDALFSAAQTYTEQELLNGRRITITYIIENRRGRNRIQSQFREATLDTNSILAEILNTGTDYVEALHFLCVESALSCVAESISKSV